LPLLNERATENGKKLIEADQFKLKGEFDMATRVDSAKDTAQEAQEQYFRVTDQVPEEVWYWAALGSIVVSASLFLMGKRDWSIFVGQWPPSFLLFGIFHKLLRPSR
jgi:hypothetical protein